MKKSVAREIKILRFLSVSLIVVILCLLGYMIAMGGPVRSFTSSLVFDVTNRNDNAGRRTRRY